MTSQLRLPLQRPDNRRRQDFIVSLANSASVQSLDAWPNWLGGLLALVGPEGCGKSHLALDWAAQAHAATVADPATIPNSSRAILFEDADRRLDDEVLFHLINACATDGVSLLLTARTPPLEWNCQLPDLRSRLNAMPVALLHPPDDQVLAQVLRKLFRERHIDVAQDLIDYLLRRIERSVPAAAAVVASLDEAGDAQRREINKALAREVLETSPPSLNLFMS